jgi:mannose-6-phosphate isomerase-like protein (cupin superfamily)
VITESELFEYVSKSYPYEQKDISVIDEEGRQIILDDFSHLMKMTSKPYTIKIESMEKYSPEFWQVAKNIASDYNHQGPVTCHLFWVRTPEAHSFPEHVDLDDVVLFCLRGTKHMTVEGSEVVINAGEELYIPKGTKHQALNKSDSIMLSFGLERFSVEKI